jgi:hypothetical protein
MGNAPRLPPPRTLRETPEERERPAEDDVTAATYTEASNAVPFRR